MSLLKSSQILLPTEPLELWLGAEYRYGVYPQTQFDS